MKKIAMIILCALLLTGQLASCRNQDDQETTISTSTKQTVPTKLTSTEKPLVTDPWPTIGLNYNRSKTGEYRYVTEKFTHEGVNYEYPQLIEMKDADKQKKINLLISGFVMNEISKDAPLGFESESGYPNGSLEVKYHIALHTPELLSIVFEGRGCSPPSAPYPHVRVLTFDINTLRVLRLRDFVQIDNDFAEKILSSDHILTSEGTITNTFLRETFTKEQIIENILGFDSAYSQVFYITPSSITVKIEIVSRVYYWVEVPLEG